MSNFFIFLYKILFSLIVLFVLSSSYIYADSTFKSDLYQGSRSEEVRSLQKILNSDISTKLSDSGLGSPGLETDFFGDLTRRAVIRFQEKYANDILHPVFLYKGTGFVGSLTRKKLNSLILSPNSSSGSQVSNISPAQIINDYPSIDNFPKEIEEGERIKVFGKNLKDVKSIKIILERDYYVTPENVSEDSFEFVFSTPITRSIKKELYSFDDLKVRKIVFDAMKKSFNSESKENLEIGVYVVVLNQGFTPMYNTSTVSFKLNK